MLYETTEDLDALLKSLRIIGADHQWVEAKRSQHALPTDLWTSLSALANSEGGLVLLGVDEQRGKFVVTGVSNPGQISAELQALCSRAEPSLRPPIRIVTHPDGNVIIAEIPPIPAMQQPCHFPEHGSMRESSFIRVGDSDEQLESPEIDEMLAAQKPTDSSRRPAPNDARLDESKVEARFGLDNPDRPELLRRFGVVDESDHPTLAAWLSLGDKPQYLSPLARVACIRAPLPMDPIGTVQNGTQIEGDMGELLDGVLAWLTENLTVTQVTTNGGLHDHLEFPKEALREAIGNALMHRSLTQAMEMSQISVGVTSESITITNPGGLHPSLSRRSLGISPSPTPRNFTLIKICEKLTTPAGARIVESQSSGISRSDRACREAGVSPFLFDVRPAQVMVIAIRGRLDIEAIITEWPDLAEEPARIVAFTKRLYELRDRDPSSVLHRIQLDSNLAARLLAPMLPEHAIRTLNELVESGILREKQRANRIFWDIASESDAGGDQGQIPQTEPADRRIPGVSKRRQGTVLMILTQLAAAPSNVLKPSEMKLGVTGRSVSNIVSDALAAEVIEATTAEPHDPNRSYRLTDFGRSFVVVVNHDGP